MEVGQVCFLTHCHREDAAIVKFATTAETEVHDSAQGLGFEVRDDRNFSLRSSNPFASDA